jgi:ribosomal protein S18 acetylase RimI-like enzyme
MTQASKQPHFNIVEADGRAERLVAARKLMAEYVVWIGSDLGVDLSFQNVDEELAALPGKYAPPAGGLWLAAAADRSAMPDAIVIDEGEVAGVIALRPLALADEAHAGEVKRLWVRPAFRSRQLGQLLSAHLVENARAMGYRALYLDTIVRMKSAIRLYQSIGFKACAAYTENPESDVVYMRLEL